ncbi:DUF185-domain-containing protein [Rickenella mellea]|uniref:Protein arginine methyltransferase NDUFAF7 n=1 Tax=Rickenella mellea TaxID=50990 RepID=A0A4Y7Q8U7_9AGAM|nr:DUF185-domain-containing protein [Rickenella mellea]
MLLPRWAARPPQATNILRHYQHLPCCRTILRAYASAPKKPVDKINYNNSTFDDSAELVNYRRVTANDLEGLTEPPWRVKMLVRDFIEDALYNPNYGYFPKQATIFTSPETNFDFNSIRDGNEFQSIVAQCYADYGRDQPGPGKQIWHTPTEIFKPWYGRAVAQCLVSEYLLKYFPYEDFIIYEIGAGNGTLAKDILDFLQEHYPEVYERTRYTLVEISGNLAKVQRSTLSKHASNAKIVHMSIFHWDIREPAPCFFVAMEVIDNFAHDMIRYDLKTLEPYQTFVTIDDTGDFAMHYTRITDPLISQFLSLRQTLSHPPSIPAVLRKSSSLRSLYTNLPFAPNLSQPEYIPTRLLSLLQTLRTHFPLHRLLLSDFSSLPKSVPGYNGPVVQTRLNNEMVTCETILVRHGYFDIFFPTNFDRLRDMYEYVLSQPLKLSSDIQPMRASPLTTSVSPLALGAQFFSSHPPNRRSPKDGVASASGLPVGQRKSNVFKHSEFMETYGDLSKTRLRNGENPMLDYYKNVNFLF